MSVFKLHSSVCCISHSQQCMASWLIWPLGVNLAPGFPAQWKPIWHTARHLSNVSSISRLQSTPSSDLECQLSLEITFLVFFYLTIKTPARDSSVMDVLHTHLWSRFRVPDNKKPLLRNTSHFTLHFQCDSCWYDWVTVLHVVSSVCSRRTVNAVVTGWQPHNERVRWEDELCRGTGEDSSATGCVDETHARVTLWPAAALKVVMALMSRYSISIHETNWMHNTITGIQFIPRNFIQIAVGKSHNFKTLTRH